MNSDFLPSFASWAATSFMAETSPNCSTRTPGWAAWMAATAASGFSTSFSTCSSDAGHLEVHDDRAAVLGDGVHARGGIERALDRGDALDPLQAAHDVLHGGRHLRIAGLDRALALHEHLLAGLVGEACGLDDHVAAHGLAVALRRLVDVVQADLAADDGGEDDEQDPAEDGRLAVLGAPSTGARCEVAGLHQDWAPSKGAGRTASSLPARSPAQVGADRGPVKMEAPRRREVAVPRVSPGGSGTHSSCSRSWALRHSWKPPAG